MACAKLQDNTKSPVIEFDDFNAIAAAQSEIAVFSQHELATVLTEAFAQHKPVKQSESLVQAVDILKIK